MKKFGSLLMSTLLCASLLAGCGSSASVSQSTVPETISTAEGAIETGSEEVSLEEMTAAKTETSTEALEESSDDTVVRVGGLKGPTTMGLVKLMDDAKNGTAANNYEFTMVTAADELTGLVASGKVDIAFASTPADDAGLRIYPCFDTHAIFVAGAEYPCDFRHVYTLEEIAAFPLILLERKASSRLYLERFFLQNGLKLNPEIELGARSLLVDLAAIGFGVAGVTEEFVRKELDSGRLKKLKTSFEIPARSVDMCLLSDVPQSAAAERFTDFVKDSLSKL